MIVVCVCVNTYGPASVCVSVCKLLKSDLIKLDKMLCSSRCRRNGHLSAIE